MLPVLKKAGVVDAGGQGFVIIMGAILDVLKGGKIAEPEEKQTAEQSRESFKTAVSEYDEEINFTYCTEFIVQKSENCADSSKLRAYLETIGDCVVVVDDEKIIKVHVHTDNPGLALQKALEFGIFINDPKPKVENMRIQHENKVKEAKTADDTGYVPAAPENKFGFVAVAAGHGIEAMFKDLGVDVVVKGGQTMNPATEDILKAIQSTPAHTVFVLPNNKNIIMAAEQAVKLADRNVCVLQTRTIPQGMTAMLNFDPEISAESNAQLMTDALASVGTGLVTFAARSSEFGGKKIKEGDIIALENGRLTITEKSTVKALVKLAKDMVSRDTSFITLIYGEDVSEEEAEKAYGELREKFGSRTDITLVKGDQPVYYFILSVE